jgi:uncharacterized protein
MKYLIWFLICLAVVTWIKRKKAAFVRNSINMHNPHNLRTPQGDAPGASGAAVETMRQCAQCGVYIPASEALSDNSGVQFCCQEHRVLHAGR